MTRRVKLPVGIENFEEIRTEGFYYIDKTGLIRELLENWGKVNLFTRPRRFGKTLNMSMLKSFFEYRCDSNLFHGLEIEKETQLCENYMGKFPVISISFKDINSRDYKTARNMLCSMIGKEALRFSFLLESEHLSEGEKAQYKQLIYSGGEGKLGFVMSEEVLMTSLLTLCELLWKHYGKKVILLIDEYDVPLDKAQYFGYYEEMIFLLRNLFSLVLKTNNSLYFAVLTGCLRIVKESIFTGLNNFSIFSITDVQYEEWFGFSDQEVKDILKFYGFEEKYELIKTWYDGYHFGNIDVYCPWDVINYCARLRSEPEAFPRAFWINSSENGILKEFLKRAKQRTRHELERLIDGKSIEKKVNQNLTYRELYNNIENLWSVLFITGYLTKCEKSEEEEKYKLKIPNLEIKQIFMEQIMEWFQEEAHKDTPRLDAFCEAFEKADAKTK